MAKYGFSINVEGNAQAKIKEISAALEGLGVKAKVETQQVGNAFTRLHNHIKEQTAGIRGLVATGLGLGVLFAGGMLMEKSVEFTNKMQEATADLHQTLISMNGAVGISETELLEMAEALDKVSTNSKPAIIAAEGMLATFGNIKGEQFKKGMQSSADYAAKFFHGDILEASKSLGIALDDPIKGMARLHRQGVSFSEEQKKQIKHYQQQGQLVKAQEIILKEIARETGGQAQARANTDEGKLEIARKQWDSIYEKVGKIINQIKIAMIPVIKVVVNVFGGFLDVLTSSSTAAGILRGVMAALAIAVGGFALAMLAVSIATNKAFIATLKWTAALLANPITWITLLIVGLIVTMMVLWDKFKLVREFLGGFWGGFVEGIKLVFRLLKDIVYILSDIVNPFAWGHLKDDLKKGWADLSEGFSDAVIKGIKKGAEDAGNSTFKFGDILKFGQGGPTKAAEAGDGKGRQAGAAAINTSNLSGASGGLGQAKVINIKIDKMQNIEHVSGGADWKAKSQNAIEVLVRTLNNTAYSQSSSQ